jgi:hypothetical protein
MDLAGFKEISGYNAYVVNKEGVIVSLPKLTRNRSGSFYTKTRVLRPVRSNLGYYSVRLSYGTGNRVEKIHRLVCLVFLPNPLNKPHVNHIDGNPSNNRLENLEWCTASENALHAFRTGLRKPIGCNGESSGASKLTWRQVEKIRLLKGKEQTNITAKRFGISRSHVWNIQTNRVWIREGVHIYG